MQSISFSYEQLSAVPQASIAEVLHKTYKQQFIQSFIRLINYAQQALSMDYQGILIQLEQLQIDSSSFISPWFYCQYFKLLASMKRDEIIVVKQTLQGLMNTSCWVIPERIIALGLQSEWEKQVFVEEVSVAFGTDRLKAAPPNNEELKNFEAAVSAALKIIAEAESDMLSEINSFVSMINLVKSDLNVGATSPKFFGAIYLSLPNNLVHLHEAMLIEHLVHETSHLYLNGVLAFDPLVLNEAEERFVSPIRTDLRPMLGIYHAAFVLSRVLRIFKRMQHLKLYDDQILNQAIDSLTKKYKAAYTTGSQQAVLTQVGKHILLSTKECVLI